MFDAGKHLSVQLPWTMQQRFREGKRLFPSHMARGPRPRFGEADTCSSHAVMNYVETALLSGGGHTCPWAPVRSRVERPLSGRLSLRAPEFQLLRPTLNKSVAHLWASGCYLWTRTTGVQSSRARSPLASLFLHLCKCSLPAILRHSGRKGVQRPPGVEAVVPASAWKVSKGGHDDAARGLLGRDRRLCLLAGLGGWEGQGRRAAREQSRSDGPSGRTAAVPRVTGEPRWGSGTPRARGSWVRGTCPEVDVRTQAL